MIGYQSRFLTETRGTGIMSRIFDSYQEKKGDIEGIFCLLGEKSFS